MPISLPAKITPSLFQSLDGRMTTEATTALAAAQAVVSNGRNIQDIKTLNRAVLVIIMYAHRHRWPPKLAYEAVGVMTGLLDRRDREGSGGLKSWVLGLLFRRVVRLQENLLLKKRGPGSPGWNQYYLALWCMTGKPQYVEELHERATFRAQTPQDHAVFVAAIRLVNQARIDFPDFDQALRAVETCSDEPIPPEGGMLGPRPGAAA